MEKKRSDCSGIIAFLSAYQPDLQGVLQRLCIKLYINCRCVQHAFTNGSRLWINPLAWNVIGRNWNYWWGKGWRREGTVCSKRFVRPHPSCGLAHRHYTALKSLLQMSASFSETQQTSDKKLLGNGVICIQKQKRLCTKLTLKSFECFMCTSEQMLNDYRNLGRGLSSNSSYIIKSQERLKANSKLISIDNWLTIHTFQNYFCD